jgi:hypothetical protein
VIESAVPALNAVFSNDTQASPIGKISASTASDTPLSAEAKQTAVLEGKLGQRFDTRLVEDFHAQPDFPKQVIDLLNSFAEVSAAAAKEWNEKFKDFPEDHDHIRPWHINALWQGHAILQNSM